MRHDIGMEVLSLVHVIGEEGILVAIIMSRRYGCQSIHKSDNARQDTDWHVISCIHLQGYL